jgi:hypothetical protein
MNDLQEVEVSRPLTLEEALRYATSLAEILRRMHRDGIVYGRLDPKYILWDGETVKLAENGADASGAYMSPEEVRGEAADERSDIFAFGAIVYELISGRRAFPAQNVEELKTQILESSPSPLEGIPEGVAALLRGCLEKSRNSRWQRMNPIVIELKLASASARQAESALEWREKMLSLRARVAANTDRLEAEHEFQDALAAELRQAVQRIEETQAAIQESIAGLQKSAQLHARALEGLQVAAAQTDEVVEHVVEAFGTMHKAMVEHDGDAKALLAARNGS